MRCERINLGSIKLLLGVWKSSSKQRRHFIIKIGILPSMDNFAPIEFEKGLNLSNSQGVSKHPQLDIEFKILSSIWTLDGYYLKRDFLFKFLNLAFETSFIVQREVLSLNDYARFFDRKMREIISRE